MQTLSVGPLYYEFSRYNAVRARVQPGETIVFETEDAFSGQVRTNADRRDKAKLPFGNPLTGPVWVEGAEPGDSLAVEILDIQPLIGQCATRTSDPRQLAEWLGTECPHGTHVCPIRDGQIWWSETLSIPYRPMLGCIGTSPDWGVPSSIPAGLHGGNMDIIETAPGATVHLPVYVPGAFFYLGDAHAAMGHGELSASGLEMPSRTTVKINLVKGKKIPGPRIVSATEIMTIATGCPMERATAQAYAWLCLWLETDYGWDRWRAYDILTHVGEISVGYYAFGTVAAKIARRYAESPHKGL